MAKTLWGPSQQLKKKQLNLYLVSQPVIAITTTSLYNCAALNMYSNTNMQRTDSDWLDSSAGGVEGSVHGSSEWGRLQQETR